MTAARIIGIDIGALGALAILDQSGALAAIHDMPVLQDGPKGRRAVNAPLLASIIFKTHADHAFVELPQGSGKGLQAPLLSAGLASVIEGVLAAAGIPIAFITPPAWNAPWA